MRHSQYGAYTAQGIGYPPCLILSSFLSLFVYPAATYAETYNNGNSNLPASIITSDAYGNTFNISESCSYYGEKIPQNIVGFKPDREALNAIDDIVRASGLKRNFAVIAAGVPNSAAAVRGSKRYIFYNQTFIRDVGRRTGNRWAGKSIMAHEIGHHLQGHTLQSGGSRPEIELEADSYSGFIMQRLGASLSDAKAAINLMSNPSASRTHPAKHNRLAAITNGWLQACEQDVSCTNEGRKMTGRVSAPERRQTAPHSCDTHDGKCDETSACSPGTASADCNSQGQGNPRLDTLYCCDTRGYRRCRIDHRPAQMGSACGCPGRGYGMICR